MSTAPKRGRGRPRKPALQSASDPKLRAKRRSKKGKSANQKLKTKLTRKEQRIVRCTVPDCDHGKDMPWKTFVSHANRKHERNSKQLTGIYRVVGSMNEHGHRINKRTNPFSTSKRRTSSNITTDTAPSTNPMNSHAIVSDPSVDQVREAEEKDDGIQLHGPLKPAPSVPTKSTSTSRSLGLSGGSGVQQQQQAMQQLHGVGKDVLSISGGVGGKKQVLQTQHMQGNVDMGSLGLFGGAGVQQQQQLGMFGGVAFQQQQQQMQQFQGSSGGGNAQQLMQQLRSIMDTDSQGLSSEAQRRMQQLQLEIQQQQLASTQLIVQQQQKQHQLMLHSQLLHQQHSQQMQQQLLHQQQQQILQMQQMQTNFEALSKGQSSIDKKLIRLLESVSQKFKKAMNSGDIRSFLDQSAKREDKQWIGATTIAELMNCIAWAEFVDFPSSPNTTSIRCSICYSIKPNSRADRLDNEYGRQILKSDLEERPQDLLKLIRKRLHQHSRVNSHRVFARQTMETVLREEDCGKKVASFALMVILDNLPERGFESILALCESLGMDVGDWRHGRHQISNYLDIFFSIHKKSVIRMMSTPGLNQTIVPFDFSVDKVSQKKILSEIFVFGNLHMGARKHVVMDMKQKEYDEDHWVLGVASVARQFVEILDDYSLSLTDLNTELGGEKIFLLVQICSDFVYVRNKDNPALLREIKKLLNVNGKLYVSDLAEQLHDPEHRFNLGINAARENNEFYDKLTGVCTLVYNKYSSGKLQRFLLNFAQKRGVRYLALCRLMPTRFATYQKKVHQAIIYNYTTTNLCADCPESTTDAKLKICMRSVHFVAGECALFGIFSCIASPLSKRNQRGDTEPGELYFNVDTSSKMVQTAKGDIRAIREHEEQLLVVTPLDELPETVRVNNTTIYNTTNDTSALTSMSYPDTRPVVNSPVFSVLLAYLPDLRNGSFRGIELNDVVLDSNMIDDDPILVEEDEADKDDVQDFLDSAPFDQIYTGKKGTLDVEKMRAMDEKLCGDFESKDRECELVCCAGDGLDGARVAQHRAIITCDACGYRQNHVWCLLQDSRIHDFAFAPSELFDVLAGKYTFRCPDCCSYARSFIKTLAYIELTLDDIAHYCFSEWLSIEELRESKYFHMHNTLNILNLVPVLFAAFTGFLHDLHDNDGGVEGKIADFVNSAAFRLVGKDSLLWLCEYLSRGAPMVFKVPYDRIALEYSEWKRYLLNNMFGKKGQLRHIHNNGKLIKDQLLLRDALLKFRSTASVCTRIQGRIASFWALYDTCKCMGTSETLVENVGSTQKVVTGDKKHHMDEDKMREKVTMRQHYKNDMQQRDTIAQIGAKIFKETIGSVCMKNPSKAKSVKKVVKRIQSQTMSGPFALPLLLED